MNVFIRNVNYHVKICGTGEPVVLLHGFTGDGTTWDSVTSHLMKYQLIIVDIIGHGKTDSPIDEKRYGMEEVVEDLKEILQFLKIDKTNIIGYSMGGRLALSFTIRYPEYVNRFVLESSSPGLKTEAERIERQKSDEALAQFILNNGIEAFVDYWENIPLFKTQSTLPEMIQKQIRTQRLQNNPIGLANSLRGMGTGSQPSWWDHLKNFQIPVFLVCGELDTKYCLIADEMDRLMPNAQKMIIQKTGHAIHVEQPRIFGKIVDEFFHSCFNRC